MANPKRRSFTVALVQGEFTIVSNVTRMDLGNGLLTFIDHDNGSNWCVAAFAANSWLWAKETELSKMEKE